MSAAPKLVLYVEDEEGDRFFMQRAFAKEGLAEALKLVPDGQAALDYLSDCIQNSSANSVPNLILLDLNLPGISGFEVLSWLRQQPALGSLPVVVFSSSARDEDRKLAEKLGANEYFEKPKSGVLFSVIVAGLRERWL